MSVANKATTKGVRTVGGGKSVVGVGVVKDTPVKIVLPVVKAVSVPSPVKAASKTPDTTHKWKALFVPDVHVRLNNLKDIDQLFVKILDHARIEKPDMILQAGDLLDGHHKVDTVPLKRATDFLNACRHIACAGITLGNHSLVNNSAFLSDVHPFASLKYWDNFIVADKVEVRMYGTIKIIYCPYTYPGRFIEALNTVPDWNNPPADLIFCHQEFRGCKLGALVSEIGDEWPLDYPMVVSGHIHTRHQLQKNIFYTGSSIQTAFGDDTDKGVYIVELEKTGTVPAKVTYREIPMNIARKITLKVTPTEALNMKAKIDKLLEEGNDIRLVIKGSEAEIAAMNKRSEISDLVDRERVKVVFDCMDEPVESEAEESTNKGKFLDQLHVLVKESPDILAAYKKVFSQVQ